ncbi:GNAT family N-acetyltransferase [Nocardioides sp. ChNu-153]|uniref:GNAT family N-acetyltransferase n=1 Tax=unclassified Nocardioides TaxID=2615069 RepID=UPI002404B1DE|nr:MULTISPECIES: GNAT family N-acetyltransferase [unclassified Nocardioides]MDF9716782.1 GNAT family N-acetyltransferase [Nocardioides sp. ChNu-99]MDN7121340.1 GNAT family N-acetyltransferase [Nocardioides sp. ChNu-153]
MPSSTPGPELAALQAAHEARLAEVDPLVRVAELPEGRVLVDGDVGAVATTTTTDSLWVARRSHALHVRAAAPDGAAWGRVLDAWLAELAGDPAATDDETAAAVTLASRDSALVAPLVRRHFGPASVLAVRILDRPDPAGWRTPPDGVVVRPAGEADVPWLLERTLDLHRWETRFGSVPERPDARASLAPELAEALARDEGWTWVAEVDGSPLAFCQVNPPEPAAWATGATWLAPAGYLVGAYVDPAHRSAGLGRVLAATAHARAVDEGWAALLLHHAGVSPWSAPFWASVGYRPLLTTWQRRPALRPGREG